MTPHSDDHKTPALFLEVLKSLVKHVSRHVTRGATHSVLCAIQWLVLPLGSCWKPAACAARQQILLLLRWLLG